MKKTYKPLLTALFLSLVLLNLIYHISKRQVTLSKESVVQVEQNSFGDFLTLDKFQYCQHLKNSKFNFEKLKIYSPDVPLEHQKTILASLIDQRAMSIRQDIYKIHNNADFDDKLVKRYACYSAVMAKNDYATGPILQEISAKNYFDMIPWTPEKITRKYKAKIAYLLMAHGGIDNYDRIVKVITSVNSQGSFIYIHLDESSDPALRNALMRLSLGSPNIQVMKRSIHVFWGLVTMVTAELAGYFELLDVAEWDFVINLSAHDYALRDTEYICNRLEKGYSYIKYWQDDSTEGDRIRDVVFRASNGHWHFSKQRETFPFVGTLTPTKQHQWMTLSRELVEYMRQDQTLVRLLAFAEQRKFSDEWLFSTALSRKDHPFKSKIVNDYKRYTGPFQPNALHPDPVTEETIPKLKDLMNSTDVFFVRKLDVLQETKVVEWIDSIRNFKSL